MVSHPMTLSSVYLQINTCRVEWTECQRVLHFCSQVSHIHCILFKNKLYILDTILDLQEHYEVNTEEPPYSLYFPLLLTSYACRAHLLQLKN